MSVCAYHLCDEIADVLLQACRVVVMLLPSDQREWLQNLHDDLKKMGRSNLSVCSDHTYILNMYVKYAKITTYMYV